MNVESMVALLRELVEIESPTGSDGVRRTGERMATELALFGGEVRQLGDHVRADFAGEGAPLLLLGHLDTVWPVGTLASMPFRIENGRAYGPGVHDMKAGLVMLLAVLAEAPGRRALRIFLTGDEEAGSPTAAPLLEDAAGGAAAALVLEPPTQKGALKTARKGLGRFRLVVHGREAHAGAHPGEGASAIEELAHQVLRLKALADPARGISVNVGVVRGGIRENVVAAHAEADIDVRIAHVDDAARIERALRSLRPELEGTTLELKGGYTRPPLERSPGAAQLFAKAREHGRSLGLELREASSGGGSDGNLVGALGVPVLDGLGPLGRHAHARNENVVLASFPVRGALLARLLEDPGI